MSRIVPYVDPDTRRPVCCASMDTIADALGSVGAALTKLGDHLAESGGVARGFLHS